MRLFVGTYTERLGFVDGKADGITSFRYDPDTGELGDRSDHPGVRNPSYLAVDASHRWLYSVNETTAFAPQPGDERSGGGVSSFAIVEDGRALQPLNSRHSEGVEPCHLAIDASGGWVAVANYRSGSLATFPRDDDGGLGPVADVVQHAGRSVRDDRQEGPHAHQVYVDSGDGRLLVPDLGLDRVLVYGLDTATGRLGRDDAQTVTLQSGAGPRHVAVHPDGSLLVLNELDSTIARVRRDGDGRSEPPTVSTLPETFSGHNQTAAIRISPDGRFVYASNRGHDSIARFAYDTTGGLSWRGTTSTQGTEPREFTLSPDGRFLLAANQNSDTIVVFSVDTDTGDLHATGPPTSVETPVCLVFVDQPVGDGR